MSPLMSEPIKHDYCSNCHLATPSWRKRCIHCYEPIERSSKDRKSGGNYKISSLRNPSGSRVHPSA